MIETGPLRRRQLLQLTGGLAAASLAGCIGASSDAQQAIGGRNTETPVPAADAGHHEPAAHHAGPQTHHDDAHGDTPKGHTPGDDPHAHEDEGHLHDEEIADPVDHAEVRMVTTGGGFHFEPHVARVIVGGTVSFVNESGAHSATAYHPEYGKPLRMPEDATPFDTGLLTDAGAEYNHSFEAEGVYQYYCIPHEGMGMIGAIIVGEPDPHGQPGLAPPQEGFAGRPAEKIEALNDMCNEALGHTHD